MTKSEVEAGESDHQYKKGLWSVEEDKVLRDYVNDHGVGQWNRIAKKTGLNRCGKSCRLRWMNYLSPKVKHDDFSEQEEDLIIRMHRLIGNRWSLIAKRVPGRTDNQVKNYWNSHLSKKLGLKRRNMTKDPGEERSLCSKADKASDIAAESTNSTGSNNRQVPEAKRNPDDDGEIKVMKRLGEVLEEKESVPSIASQDQSYVSTSWQLPEEELEPITTLTIMDYHFFNGYCSFDLV